MKVIITGIAGYIGSITAYEFLRKGYQVVGLDNLSTGFRQPIEVLSNKFGQDNFKFYEVDLKGNLDEILEKEKDAKAIVHFAGSIKVSESMEDPQKYFSNNVGCSQNLFKTAIEKGIKNIVFSSTCAVYGEAKVIPIDESHQTNPTNPYGESKRMVEKMLEWYGNLLDLKYVILRYFNVCGVSDDGVIGYSQKPSNHLVQNAVKGALGIEPFYVTCAEVDTPDKTPIRDYINVVDLAEAHIKAVEYLVNGGRSEIINLGTGSGDSVLEIVDKVQELTGIKFEVNKSEAREGEYAKAVADIEKAKKVLDWQPKRELADSVQSLLRWFKQHPQGWDY